MSEESTTPDLVELARRSFESLESRDSKAMMSFFGPDPVFDTSLAVYEGRGAVQGFFEDWLATWELLTIDAQEILDLGGGVVFNVILQTGRLAGSSGEVKLRYAAIGVWVDGLLARVRNYTDIDEGRAAAERLAGERG